MRNIKIEPRMYSFSAFGHSVRSGMGNAETFRVVDLDKGSLDRVIGEYASLDSAIAVFEDVTERTFDMNDDVLEAK